jgi:hypothetical protein
MENVDTYASAGVGQNVSGDVDVIHAWLTQFLGIWKTSSNSIKQIAKQILFSSIHSICINTLSKCWDCSSSLIR